jgi:hypothetical protein
MERCDLIVIFFLILMTFLEVPPATDFYSCGIFLRTCDILNYGK